jgi:murein DD-endopeptidase
MTRHRLLLREIFGFSPLPLRAKEAWLALRGDESTPATRFDASSLGILMPVLSVRTWFGWRRPDRLVPISNLFNHTQTPLEDGWSVRKTQTRDFRGGTLTYDSHNGTDFAVPVGTIVAAAAPGRVLRISSEFNRGGLKIFMDHGRGLVTTYNHLARALVSVGDQVARGQPVALSGVSGLDGVAAFPWSVPHMHFNAWLNGEYVDPFASHGAPPLWIHANEPRPHTGAVDNDLTPTPWDKDAVNDVIQGCRDSQVRDELNAASDLDLRAMNVLFHLNYYPTRFKHRARLASVEYPRQPRLTLPFRPDDFMGIALD